MSGGLSKRGMFTGWAFSFGREKPPLDATLADGFD
jgi:hypothetical protein